MSEMRPLKSLLSAIVDNRGRTCPVAEEGLPLIATNCVKNSTLFPVFEKVRYVDNETYNNWFRGHPVPGDLIFVLKGSPGRVCLTPDPVNFCIAQDMVALRANPDVVYPEYLFAALRAPETQEAIGNLHVGSMIAHFKKGDFDRLLVPVPDMQSQIAIGDLYMSICKKIERNSQTTATLEEMARALYRSWFVDFDPVHAKAAGRPPAHMDAATAALFPDSFGEDGLPEGWKMAPLHLLAQITMGLSPKGSTYNAAGKGTPLCNGPVEYGDYFLQQIKWTTAPTRIAQRGDLIVCVRGSTTGRHAFADTEYCLGRGVAGIRGREGAQEFIDTSVLFNLDRLLEKTTGSVFPSLSKNDIWDFEIVDPSKELVQGFCKATRAMKGQIWLKIEENQTLATLRDTLLPRLKSGELRVGAAREQLEEMV